MTVENNGHCCANCRMPVLVQCSALVRSSNGARFAGSVSCFTSIAIDRVDHLRVVRLCQRSIESVSTSKRRHMACCCVCMQVNETGHAQRLNMLKWFLREENDLLSSLRFVVNYLARHTIASYRKCFRG